MIKTITMKVCDICEEEIEKNEKAIICPICNKEVCPDCQADLLSVLLGDKAILCEDCADVLERMDSKTQKLFHKEFYKPIMDFCKKTILTEKI